ncbi:MAG TPA: hypothetical protein VE549_15600, partial [Myxococcaceae bacterium]|nr:hypothetical protein [Myxococcaceae bacterium]
AVCAARIVKPRATKVYSVAETKLGSGSMEVSYDRQELDEFVAGRLIRREHVKLQARVIARLRHAASGKGPGVRALESENPKVFGQLMRRALLPPKFLADCRPNRGVVLFDQVAVRGSGH